MKPHPKRGNIFPSRADPAIQVPFEEAFPEIQAVQVEVTETGEGNHGLGVRRFNKLSIREFINCSNHRCGGKGICVGEVLRDMIRERQTDRVIDEHCQSHEETGKACPNTFEVQIQIEFKDVHG